jgi:hypothetical protein
VAVRTPQAVSISADSKAHYSGGATGNVCKIYRAGRLYFAIAGLDHDQRRGFYPARTVAASFEESATFSHAVEKVKQLLKGQMKAELKSLKTNDKSEYAYAVKSGEPLSLVFAEVRDGIPYLGGFGFKVSGANSKLTDTQIVCPGDCPDGEYLLHLGASGALVERIQNYKRSGQTASEDELTRLLVQSEIEVAPTDVGPPIVTLHLDVNGATWVSNDSGCPIVAVPE